MQLSLVTGPVYEPVKYSRARDHLNLPHDRDLELIENIYLPAAREYVENYTHQTLVQRTYDWSFNDWTCFSEHSYNRERPFAYQIRIPLPLWPTVSVSSITYTDTGTSPMAQTVNSSIYSLNATTKDAPAYLYLNYNQQWPSNRGWENDITVRFIAGYAADTTVSPIDYGANVPKSLINAILMLTGGAYRDREDTTEMERYHNKLIDNLLKPHVMHRL